MQNLLAHENTFHTHPMALCWTNMLKLRRLVIDHTYIDGHFVRYIQAMPCLEQVVLLNPRWREGGTRIFRRLLDSVSNLQSVHLVFLGATSVIPSVTHIVDKMAELRAASDSITELPGVHVIAMIGDNKHATFEYTHDLISCGDIWTLSSGFIEIEERMVNISDL
ncbi:hypothetical protein BDZ94DRAFT_1253358 [Collybia nuda]|uniref:Uncharacterized protein n=1 Tax=Collybia nuda TaxID=64659 RepID=A0A9P5YAZ3_9AGAR|nr:hypothetical protein BDZ94DRAFT_1253358 [Collybia nuda]